MPVTVTIGNGPDAPAGINAYLNAGVLADTLAFVDAAVFSDLDITFETTVDLETSPNFGATIGDLTLQTLTLHINGDIAFGSGVFDAQVLTVNLNGRLTTGGAAIGGARLSGLATQVNVLSNAASIQQAIDLADPAGATVHVAADDYSETIDLSGANITLDLSDVTLADFDVTIGGFGLGDTLVLPSDGAHAAINGAGDALQIYDANGVLLGAIALSGWNGANALVTVDGEATVVAPGGGGALTFTGTTANESVVGTDGADTLSGGDGHDMLWGSAGNDQLQGGQGNDRLDGGAGNDTQFGGDGDDTYILRGGDGVALNYSSSYNIFEDVNQGTDTLRVVGNPADLRITSNPYNSAYLSFGLGDGAGGFTFDHIYGVLTPDGVDFWDRIERVVFEDGTVWDATTGLTMVGTDDANNSFGTKLGDRIEGRAGNDQIFGYDGADTLDGGLGNDTMQGGDGDDTYILRGGDGVALNFTSSYNIFEDVGAGTDTLRVLANPADLRISSNPYNSAYLSFGLGDGAGGFTFDHIYGVLTPDGVDFWDRFESVVFADGTVWTATTGLTMIGTDDGVTTAGTTRGDSIEGRGGNDTLNSYDGDDRLDGGLGNDIMQGGDGNDTYVLRGGDGVALNFTSSYNIFEDVNAGTDTLLVIGNPADLRVTSNPYNSAYLSFGLDDGAGGFTFEHIYGALTPDGVDFWDRFERVVFSDGTVWDASTGLTMVGTDDANNSFGTKLGDRIEGRAGNDQLMGYDGDDTLDGGLGNDTLQGGDGDDVYILRGGDGVALNFTSSYNIFEDVGAGADTIRVLANPGDLRITSNPYNTAYLSFGVSDGAGDFTYDHVYTALTVDGLDFWSRIENVRFADGTVWTAATGLTMIGTDDAATTLGTTAKDTIEGRGGADSLNGYDGDDVLTGGAGADTITGGDGSDTAVFSGAQSDYLIEYDVFGPGTVRVTDLRAGAPDGVDTIYETEFLAFNDGTISTTPPSNSAPSDITLSGGTIAENAANGAVVGTAAGVDADAGDTLTYALLDNAGGRFAINASTGVITVANGTLLNYESATQHGITVRVTDEAGEHYDESFVIGVTNANEPVVITSFSGDDLVYIDMDENFSAVATVQASDPDAGASITYSIVGGADAARFTVNPTTGALTFVTAPNYEDPQDADEDNVYDVVVRASSGGHTDDQAFEIWIYDDNEAPVITSNGGGSTANISLPEGSTVVTQVLVSDPDAGEDLTYSISGGADAARFQIDANTGELSFINPPDFESPADVGANNVYNVTVRVRDSGLLSDTQSIAITVTNVVEGSVINGQDGVDDFLEGGAGNDTINGLSGEDELYGFAGADVLHGGADDDYLIGGAGADVNDGGAGNDRVVYRTFGNSTGSTAGVTVNLLTGVGSGGHAEGDTYVSIEDVDGSAWGDVIIGNNVGNFLVGNDGHDDISGNDGADTLLGGAGDDVLDGGAGDDYIEGNAGADDLSGGDGTDIVSYVSSAAGVNVNLATGAASGGDAAGDTVSGFESLWGSQLNDTLTGDNDFNWLVGWAGHDTLNGAGGSDILEGDAGDDTLNGGDGYDSLEGGDGADILNAGADGASMTGGAGADQLIGGSSWQDAASYQFSTAGVTINLVTGVGAGGEAEGDTLSSVEWVFGSQHNDTFIGSGANEVFYGFGGNDSLNGGGGVDWAFGFDGNRSDYLIVTNQAGVTTVTDLRVGSPDGTDTLVNMEQILFNDGWYEINQLPNDITLTGDSVAEDAAIGAVVGQAAGVDPNTAETLTYALTDNAGGRFAINATTGAITVAGALDYETAQNHQITIRVTDAGGLHYDEVFTVNVTNVVEATITSNGGGDTAAVNVNENTTLATTVAATGAAAITYTIVGGADAARFSIDANTGALSFVSAPNFEAPTDQGANNVYDVIVRASDGASFDDQSIAVTVLNVNEAPVITSNGGGNSAAVSINENTTTVTTVQATPNGVGAITYTIVGGLDQTRFSIDANTGALRFVTAPDFEAPADNGGDNVYDVIVRATQAGLSDDQSIAVTVLNTNENVVIEGDNNANVIPGTPGVETILGLGGDDVIEGLGSGDVINGGDGVDTASYAQSNVGVSIDLRVGLGYFGHAAGDTLISIESLVGSAFNDTLIGTSGVNTFSGGDGADTIWTGAGSDVVFGDSGDDWVAGEDGNDALYGEEGMDTLYGDAGDDYIEGGADNDTLHGYTGADTIFGGGGDDYITGGTEADTLYGEDGHDLIWAGSGSDLAQGGVGDDWIAGEDGDDTIYGQDGNDTLYGDAGNDLVDGGVGADRINGWTGNDTLTGGDGNDTIWAGDGVDRLEGGAGDDWLTGGAGGDVLIGNGGSDGISYAGSGAAVTINLNTGAASGGDAAGDSFQNIEKAEGSNFNDTLTGDSANNTLFGLSGDDRLNGAAGADLLYGHAGIDRLDGGDGADWLVGGAGGDILNGGAGADGVSYWDSDAGVSVNLNSGAVSGGHAAGDTLSNFENIEGSTWSDTLTGNGGANVVFANGGADTVNGAGGNDTLFGHAGVDRLDGGADNDWLAGGEGADVLNGGAGSDGAFFTAALAGVIANLTTGLGTGGEAAGDTYANIEHLQGSSYNDVLTGAAGSNTLFGGAGADLLNGMAGADFLLGEDGDDTLIGGAGNDSLDGGAGFDTADYSGSNAAIVVNLGSGAASGGHAAGDSFTSIEAVLGSAFADTIVGSGGANTLRGGAGADIIRGQNGADTIEGGDGADDITGGAGGDTLWGNAGADDFIFTATSESGVGVNTDMIMDFLRGTDRIDLSGIDARTNAGGNQAFTFIGSADFSGVAGQLRYVQDVANGVTHIYGDVNGNNAADFQITLAGLYTLTGGDFVL